MISTVVKCIIENSALDIVSNTLMLVVSVVNLVFVVCIYFKDKKDAYNERRKKYKFDWFQMIDIKDRVCQLNGILEDLKRELNLFMQNPEDSLDKRTIIMQDIIAKYNVRFFDEKSKFTYMLKCVDNQKNIDISNLYNKFQEEYLNQLLKARSKENLDFSKLFELVTNISNKFYDFGYELV